MGAVTPGAPGVEGGVVQRPMIAGTCRCLVGDTLFGALEGIPVPTSKARNQIWKDVTRPATTRAAQVTRESQVRIGAIIVVP